MTGAAASPPGFRNTDYTIFRLADGMQSIISRIEIQRFIAVGGIGFMIDGGILTLLVAQGAGVYVARAISFPVAVSVTWLLNRAWTFSPNRRLGKGREYIAYLLTQLCGAGINLAVFVALTQAMPALAAIPLVPLAAGAAAALVFNFSVSKILVFGKKAE